MHKSHKRKRSLEKQSRSDIQEDLYERREEKDQKKKRSLKSMKRRPMLGIGCVGVVHHFRAYRICSSRVVRKAARLCASTGCGEGRSGGRARSALPRQVTEERYHVLNVRSYVKAAYCGANPVSHPKPLL